uniref:Glutamine amidotransferase-like class 1 domain-containing protein 1 n=2 Tax=Bos TaxID=9903 RepID=A0AAF6YV27_BOVIN
MASERLPSRPACLLVASGAAEGVSAQSFLHCFTLASAAFNLQVATPGGKTMDFVDVNESNARWVQDFRLKAYASPAKLESIDGARYHALLIPSCPGALVDLASSGSLARILQHFHSESKPICAVGHGVAALCCATSEDRSWVFQGYSVTGPASLTPCMWCWIATWSPGRTPAPPSLPCRTCSSSVAAGSEEAPGQAPSRCHHLQMSWVSPETLPRDTRPAWALVELLGGSEDPP